MTSPEDPRPGFEDWLRSVTFNADSPEDDQGDVSPANRRWLRRFFEVEGGARRDLVDRAFLKDQVALAKDAASAVLSDLHRTSALRPTVTVDDYEGTGVRIWVNGGYTAPSMWAIEKPEALVEVALYIQDQLDLADYLQEFEQADGCWPLCDEHGVGLRAEVREGIAVWWCRAGHHGVAPIGHLGAEGGEQLN